MRNFRAFDFWVDSKNLAVALTKSTKNFPPEERYALGDQIRRAAVSIAANIAEGAGRTTISDFAHFLSIAIGSAYEVETHIEIAHDLSYITDKEYDYYLDQLTSIQRRLAAFKTSLLKPKQ